MSRTFYLTTAIDYVNSKPHLGTAYEKIAADAIARAHRLLGYDVLFVMGNDEHSVKVEKSAKEEGLTPKAYCDRMEEAFRNAWSRLAISFDDFIRTSEPRHHASVQELLRRVRANGHIKRGTYNGWYCEGCEAFYTEKDLVDGMCPNHATKPRWVEEENWFFELSKFRDPLLAHIREHPGFIRPESRRNEIVAFLEGGLQDLSISRAGIEWGIPFPDDPDHVVYVWFDALTNYISAAGFGTDEEKFAKWWPADVHVIGKDITRFHCVIWPAMLMAAGVPVPKTVFGHGFIYHSGTKMSKSLGNIVSPLDVVERTGADPLRYYLCREIVFGNDGDFTWDHFISRYNSDLANDLGNLVKRVTDMTSKFLGGHVRVGPGGRTGLRALAERTVRESSSAYESFDLSGALSAVWALVRRANQVVQETKPWELAKDESRRDELSDVLGEIVESVRVLSHLIEPVLPGKCLEIRGRLGVEAEAGALWEADAVWREGASWKVAGGPPVFPRLEHEKDSGGNGTSAGAGRAGDGSGGAEGRESRTKSKKKKKDAAGAASRKGGLIDIGSFQDVQLVVATVKSASRVEGADKLLKLELDLGRETRQVVSGIADRFVPDELVGRQVVVVANLKPARIRGVDSQGMILVAQSGDQMTLLAPGEAIAPGAKIS